MDSIKNFKYLLTYERYIYGGNSPSPGPMYGRGDYRAQADLKLSGALPINTTNHNKFHGPIIGTVKINKKTFEIEIIKK